MDFIALFISLAALTISVITFCYDLSIKRIVKQNNIYQLEKNKEEEIESKKACLSFSLSKINDKGINRNKRQLIITNKGKATAKDIKITIANKDITVDNNKIKEILPDDQRIINLTINNFSNQIQLNYSWVDNHFVNDNSNKVELSLL
jgi:uncharacterized membrane protein